MQTLPQGSWGRFLLYTVMTVVWIQAFPIVLACMAVKTYFFPSGPTFVQGLTRGLCDVELHVHRYYDTVRPFVVPNMWNARFSVGRVAMYIVGWKVVQRGFFAVLDAAFAKAYHDHPFRLPLLLPVYVAIHMTMIRFGAWVTDEYYNFILKKINGYTTAAHRQQATAAAQNASPSLSRASSKSSNSGDNRNDAPAEYASLDSVGRKPVLRSLDMALIYDDEDMDYAIPSSTGTSSTMDAESSRGDYSDISTSLPPTNMLLPPPPTKSSYYTVLTPHHAKSTEVSYGQLSPTNATDGSNAATARRNTFAPTYRSIQDNTAQDDVHFHAFAPALVTPSSCFRFDVWAFLVSQRDDMVDKALASGAGTNHKVDDDDAHQLQRDELLPVRRGALAHVSLEVPAGFELYDEPTQVLSWEGQVTSVKYQVLCTPDAALGQVLFKSTIVVGSKVMILRSYVLVGHDQVRDGGGGARELKCNLEVLPASFHEIPYDDLDIQELVGQGHFGDAYRATYQGKQVVVKTVRGSEFGDTGDQIVHEFRHEAAVLSMFGHHPNIVPFVGACTDITKPLSLVTEFLPCGNLEAQYKRGLSETQKTRILRDAASGLLNIHEGGFIHRDIAARNILVDENYRAKVCDFGLCRRVSLNCGLHIQTKSGVGPIKYMAPETLLPPHAFSYKSDSYAFGVLMWETFMETPPFADMPAAAVATHVLEGGRLDVSQPSIPQPYQELIAKCFEEDPTRRPSMAELVEILRAHDGFDPCSFSKWLFSKRSATM
ncbi:Aste57867_16163 [Aphanomyces stellatus]|uniref:Aste57867_16163 protein n=1 Tax=Aphanomyces stellatus TaxID=120398 RepID=A0A485L5T9_9STRA|nr:hypothetical protein As57867_016107 [Aphanomyces stellatus]VFT92942.1 Aste57867_16163 [Aphanomyces stellatus]